LENNHPNCFMNNGLVTAHMPNAVEGLI